MGGDDLSFRRLVFIGLLGLLVLLYPKEAFATTSYVGTSVCLSDHLTYTKPYHQGTLFTINGNPVDIVRFCEAIRFHKAKGCIFEDSFSDDFCTSHYLLGNTEIYLREFFVHLIDYANFSIVHLFISALISTT